MNIINKYYRFKNSSVYLSFLLAFTQSIIALLFIGIDFFFSKELSVKDFGVWKQLMFVVNLIIPILSFGIAEGYKYYLAKDGKKIQTFANTFYLYFSITVLFFAVVLLVNILGFLGFSGKSNSTPKSFLIATIIILSLFCGISV